MARTIKVPYFTVNAYGQLTVAGETAVSVPEGTVSWNDIVGKPVSFPATPVPLMDAGAGGESLIVDPNTMFLRRLEGSRAASVNNTATTSVIDVPYPYSAGLAQATVPDFTDNEDGTATFGSCSAALYSSADGMGSTEVYTVPEATLSFVAGAQEYACISYNGGSPEWVKITDPMDITGRDIILIFVIWRQDDGTELHSVGQDSLALALPNKINSRLLYCEPYGISTIGGGIGPVASETTTPNPRTITVSGATVFKGVAKDYLTAFDSSVDKLTKAVHTATGWVYTDTPVYDNLHYNPDSLGEVEAGNNKWIYRLYFRSVGDVRQVFYVESTEEYNSEGVARSATEAGRTDLPPLLTGHCILVGRSIIQHGATNGVTEAFIRTGGYFTSAVPNHNDLTNIQGGTTDEYYHLTARQYGTVGYTPHFMFMGS